MPHPKDHEDSKTYSGDHTQPLGGQPLWFCVSEGPESSALECIAHLCVLNRGLLVALTLAKQHQAEVLCASSTVLRSGCPGLAEGAHGSPRFHDESGGSV